MCAGLPMESGNGGGWQAIGERIGAQVVMASGDSNRATQSPAHPDAAGIITDLDGCVSDPLLSHYGGAAGRKACYVIDGEPWMIKFPKMSGARHAPSSAYPVAEYIGSGIYRSLGIDVHEVRLGVRETTGRDGAVSTKIVAMCRDFATESPVVSYGDVKSSLGGELFSGGFNGSDPRGEPLTDALTTIGRAELFQMAGREAAYDRFWDMFVTDAFIGNPARGNSDWGLQISRRGDVALAPVYDNGGCLFARQGLRGRSLAAAAGQLGPYVNGTSSFFAGPDGRHIRSFGLIASGRHPGLTDALGRFMERVDMDAIRDIVLGIPETYENATVLPDAMADLIVKALEWAYAKELEPAWRGLSMPAVPAG